MTYKKILAALAVAAVAALLLPLRGLAEVGSKAEAHGGDGTRSSTFTGSYSTDGLLANASHWFVKGISQRKIMSEVYAPFIIGGKATWTDTWGAPRYGPAPGQTRSHEGQDVFCEYGDPVLASESGTIEFDNQSLGGLVARLHRGDGSYWYYAHLSAFNTGLSSGDAVGPGDIIAYCGKSGNASSTPPHVHFGWYDAAGNALDPMGPLVRWLGAAAGDLAAPNIKTQKKKPKRHYRTTAKASTTGRTAVLELDIKGDVVGDQRAARLRKTKKTVDEAKRKVKEVGVSVSGRVNDLLEK